MSYLQLQNLHRDFGTVKALNGIDISLGEGEFLSLLGPSGCGKTTALRLVAGFDRPDEGRIVVDGKDITGMPPNKRDMGMVFQAYSLFPNMTARQNVEFGLKIRGRDKGDRTKRVDDLLELVGLGHAADRYPHQLSGGMQQRVALARALAIEPRVLLLDEPLSALDAKVRVQLREEIRRIQLELGITTLYVTHDQEEALAISDHVAVMFAGVIEQMGTPAEMYTAPATPFVAEFIGTMNRLEATVVDSGNGEIEHAGTRLQHRRRTRPSERRARAPARTARGARGRGADERRRAERLPRRSPPADVSRLGDPRQGRCRGHDPGHRHVCRPRRGATGRGRRWWRGSLATTRSCSACRRTAKGCQCSTRIIREDPGHPELAKLEHPPLVVDRVDGRLESEQPPLGDSAGRHARRVEARRPREPSCRPDRGAVAHVLDGPEGRAGGAGSRGSRGARTRRRRRRQAAASTVRATMSWRR